MSFNSKKNVCMTDLLERLTLGYNAKTRKFLTKTP